MLVSVLAALQLNPALNPACDPYGGAFSDDHCWLWIGTDENRSYFEVT